jgi:hypothetical protein
MRGTLIIFLFCFLKLEAQDITVRSYKEDDVDFRKYATYFWASQVDNQTDQGVYFYDDLMLKADIRDAVHAELEGRGYRMDDSNPDLLVNFRVFDKAGTIRGVEGYGSRYWGENEISFKNSPVDEIKVDAGTLIISLLDKKEGRLVWQGFASGLIDSKELVKDEGKIREAVNLIFEDYGNRVHEYTRR